MISHMVSAEEESRVCKEDRYVWEIGNLNGMAAGKSLMRNLRQGLEEWGNWQRCLEGG